MKYNNNNNKTNNKTAIKIINEKQSDKKYIGCCVGGRGGAEYNKQLGHSRGGKEQNDVQ